MAIIDDAKPLVVMQKHGNSMKIISLPCYCMITSGLASLIMAVAVEDAQ
jgi:hypothetical protein